MKKIELIKLHDKQKEVVKGVLREDIFFCVAVIGRQFGKTTMAENLALYWSINNDNIVVYWVSPTNNQAYKVYEEILNSVIHTGVVKSNKGSGGIMEIEFLNGSKIQFRSAEAENNLRGGSVDYMILDEAAFIKKSTFETILEPMLTVKGKKCLFISTPKGKNYLYELYMKGIKMSPKWVSFRFRTIDSPLANKEFILEKKTSLNEKIYLQEYEAEFVDSASLFNNLSEVMFLDKLNIPILGNKYYAGVDIGLINDASVLSIIDDNGNMVNYFRWENIKSPDLINKIIELNIICSLKRLSLSSDQALNS